MQDNTTPTPTNDMSPAGSPPPDPQVQRTPLSDISASTLSFERETTQAPAPETLPLSTQSFGAPASTESIPKVPSNSDITSPFVAVETEMTKPTEPVQTQSFAPPATPVAPATPTGPASQKSNKRKIIIGGVIASVLVILGAGGAAAYNVWYQNPDKVLSDALVNAMKAKTVAMTGTVNVETKELGSASDEASTFKLTVDSKSTSAEGEMNAKLAVSYADQKFDLSGSGLYDKDANFYFKVNNVRKTIDSFATSGIEVPKAFDDIIKKIDGRWIKVGADDLKEYSDESAKTKTCTEEAFKKLEDDKSLTKEIVDLYKKHTFVVVKEKLASENGSLGYLIETDNKKAKLFVSGLNQTKIAKELQKCDESFKLDAEDIKTDSKSDATTRIEVWVDRWSHQLTKLHLTNKEDETSIEGIVEPVFNQSVSFTTPKDALSIGELKKDIEKAMTAYTDSIYGNSESLNVEATLPQA